MILFLLTCILGSASAYNKASARAVDAEFSLGGGLAARDVTGVSVAGLLPPVDDPLLASAFSSSNGLANFVTCNTKFSYIFEA